MSDQPFMGHGYYRGMEETYSKRINELMSELAKLKEENAEMDKVLKADQPHLIRLAQLKIVARQMFAALTKVAESEQYDHKAQEEFGGYVLPDELRHELQRVLAAYRELMEDDNARS
jgi:hypothetical protein